MSRRSAVLLLVLLALAGVAAWWLVAGCTAQEEEADALDRTRTDPAPDAPSVLYGTADAVPEDVGGPPPPVLETMPLPAGFPPPPPPPAEGPEVRRRPDRITGRTADPTTGEIRLRVGDGDGHPRAGVRVLLNASVDGQFTRTHDTTLDARGEAFLERVPPGYASLTLRSGSAGLHVQVQVEGGRLTEVVLTFPVGVTVTGTVRHATKGPLAQIRVVLQLQPHGLGGTASTTTDAEGRYRLDDVPPGTHPVALTGPSIGHTPRPRGQVVVEAGRNVVHDFVLGRVSIRGTVADASTGAPLPEVAVHLSGIYAQAMTNAAGAYEFFDVAPGHYNLHATKTGYQAAYSGSVEVVADTATTWNAALEPGATILFVLRTASGAPVPGPFRVLGSESASTGVAVTNVLTADEEGRARLPRLVPGTWRFDFLHDTCSIERTTLEIGVGETIVELLCEPAPEDPDAPAPTLRGHVLDRATREPIPGVHVRSQTAFTESVVTDAQGGFAFRRLVAGTHDLVVSRRGYGMRILRDVEVRDGVEDILEVELDRAATLHLHVTDAEGEPVVGTLVLSISPKEGTAGTSLGTGLAANAQGHAVYEQIVPGDYELTIRSEARGQGTVEIRIRLGENTAHVRLE